MFDSTVFLLVTLLLVSGVLWMCCRNRQQSIKWSTPSTIRILLSPKGVPISRLLGERASANLRLARSLSLTNTFVSSSTTVHQTFVTSARDLLKQSQLRGWVDFRNIATQAVQLELSFISHAQDSNVPRYDVFIQCITLRVVLVGLLGIDASVESFLREDVILVAANINTLWSLSKSAEPIPPHYLSQLSSALRRLMLDGERFPQPLDVVIPAWETLWRVVSITIAFAHDDPSIRELFARFYRDPVAGARSFKGDQGKLTARNVIDEAMRLHPPSKHIARIRCRCKIFHHIPVSVFNWIDGHFPTLLQVREYADIAEVQKDGNIWGTNASQFDPSRHSSTTLTPEQEEALAFGFGHGSLRCVGASWAPIAVAVITSAVFEFLDGKEYTLIPGPALGGRVGWEGWAVSEVSC